MQIIDRQQVERVLSPAACLQLSRDAFALVSQGKVRQTLRSVIASDHGCLMGTMPAYIAEGPYAGFGVKTVKVDFSHSDKRTSHEGSILLFDAADEGEMALVDAASVTELRTAAASALATDLLAPAQASRLAMLGTGVQAQHHLKMMLAVRPIRQVSVWGRSEAGASAFAAWCRQQFGLAVTVAATPAQAVRDAEIICSVTASKQAFLYGEDLPHACHINAIGASALGFQELSPEIYAAVRLYVDSREAAWNASSCMQQARQQGFLPDGDAGTEIGELIANSESSTGGGAPKTLFKSVGLAAQDLVFARAVVALSKPPVAAQAG
ncbi:ornithine cyclodeaminase family protein [Chromobacterium sp. IIBBL 290-4]|uniref:ornithine cyclodeaminase family protein n=1 Tax=Chromobacterium sp. IIBBL 290-4 TaxID=2953890 RepID=UPI0020B85192|nr:ornithine cyclodeaminase family protein [Chromobacterium sp. IIBBL 290-4]UTH75621.1 ornithine cyclodeaminase family protein [Chromobacterium sp. IIBBL 290-4]